jgi:lipopolysaccharide/colanic/teichoic acid biosynthesis glycosyltransferase
MELTEVVSVEKLVQEELLINSTVFRVAYLSNNFEQFIAFTERFGDVVKTEFFGNSDSLLHALYDYFPADVIIASVDRGGWQLLDHVRSNTRFGNIPFILLVNKITPEIIQKAKDKKSDDVFSYQFTEGDLVTRLHYFVKRQWYVAGKASKKLESDIVKIPLWKRTFDVVGSFCAILLLLPIFATVALLIFFDSKGPIFYKSKRVGMGYTIFNLYKFRTMRTDADQLIKKMANQSMYNKGTIAAEEEQGLCEVCRSGGKCGKRLFLDGKEICEEVYHHQRDQKAAFLKFQNDPRVTRIGRFLRNSSLDELPQLINILKGDMSIVGNRPLPLYEAEKLTTDETILRFAGPGGLTGLWQVTKRGKGKEDMSEEERMELDVTYAKNFSFWMDMKIVFKTFPALFQSENV